MGAKFDLSKIKGIGAPEQNNQKGAVGAGLLNMASKAQAAVNRATIYVPYEKIIPNEKNGMSLKDIDELAQLIELAGLQQPLVVKELEDGNYKILTGGRRYLAIGKLIREGKWDPQHLVEVKVQDMDKLDIPLTPELKELFEIMVTNQHRNKDDKDKYFEAIGWKKIIQEFRKSGKRLCVVGYDDDGNPIEEKRTLMISGVDSEGNEIVEDITGVKTRDIISQKINASPAYIGQIEKIENNGTQELKDALMNEKVGISLGSEIAGMDEEDQKEFLQEKEKEEKITSDDLRKFKYEKKDGKKDETKQKELPEETESEEENLPGTLITEKQLKADLKKVTKALKANGGIRLDDSKYNAYIRQISLLEKLFV